MFVYRSTVAAATFAGALLVGCAAPDQPTDLRTDGPPNVTAVMVMSDLKTSVDPNPPDLDRLIESATHCRLNDEKRPALVGLPTFSTTQVCPDDLSMPSETEGTAEGAPPSWFVRVVFDQLLDPDVEELVDQLDANGNPTGVKLGSLLNTQPVALKCNGVDVPYDRAPPRAPISYYVPNGNRISWPLGPALYIQPDVATSVPVGASCEISIKDIVRNKSGESVPMDQRSFAFKIAPMELRFSNPDPADGAPGAIELDPASPVEFYWTAAFTTMPDPTEIHIFEGADATVCGTGGTPIDPADIETSAAGTGAATTALIMNLGLKSQGPDFAWKANTTYRVEFGANAKITPTQGGADGIFPAGYKLCFHTTAAL